MAHKLAHQWTVYSYDLDKVPPTRIEEGVMDLTTMSADGKLDEGTYKEFETTSMFKIKGQATGTEEFMHLSLKNKERSERWSGVLVFDQGDEMKIAGAKIVSSGEMKVAESSDISSRLAAQDEEPWLITKP